MLKTAFFQFLQGQKNFFRIALPIVPAISPNRFPIAQKIANTMKFPATKSLLDIGVIMAYRVHLAISSKEKVVTIIMLHRTAHTKIYPSIPEDGIKTTTNIAMIKSMELYIVRDIV